MPVHHSLWKIAPKPLEVPASTLVSEQELEDMIVAEPRLLSEEWMLVGRQVHTGLGGRVDLLAIAPDATLVLIELKRDRTPRDVVAQSLDYAFWVGELEPAEIAEIYTSFQPQRSLAQDFHDRFGHPLDEDELNSSHQIVIVAASLDGSSERIVTYLNKWDVPINVMFFQVFQHDGQKFLSRAWMLDPADVQVNVAATARGREQEPWNGEYYVSFGADVDRSWEEAVRYGFVSAGGGRWYSNSLKLLEEGSRIWAKIPGKGFVGVGRVTGPRFAAGDFQIDGKPALDVLTSHYHRRFVDDPDMAEYFVPVHWLDTVPEVKAIQEVGMFGNQNTVCRPKTPGWRTTVERLKAHFPGHNDKL